MLKLFADAGKTYWLSLPLFFVVPLGAAAETLPAPSPLQLVTLESPFEDGCQSLQYKLIHEALKRLSLPYQCEAMPWARAQRLVRLGERDGFITIRTLERSEYTASTSVPVMELNNSVFTYRQHPKLPFLQKITSLSELKGLTVATYLGDGWTTSRLVPLGIDIEWSSDMQSVLRMLAAQRADVVIQSDIDTLKQIRLLDLGDKLIKLDNVLDKTPYYLMLGRHSTYLDRLPAISATLATMREDGSYKAIYRQFEQAASTTTPAPAE